MQYKNKCNKKKSNDNKNKLNKNIKKFRKTQPVNTMKKKLCESDKKREIIRRGKLKKLNKNIEQMIREKAFKTNEKFDILKKKNK